MAHSEIIGKLAEFLKNHPALTEECHAVYLLVEIRKIIDHENNKTRYPLLKFYADWSVHTSKDGITPEIKTIIRDVYSAAFRQLTSPNPVMGSIHVPMMEFAYMAELGKEMERFLGDHDIDHTLATQKPKWVGFVELLVKVLENQPINNPIDEVISFVFEPANNKCLICAVHFKQPVNGQPFYRFENAY